MTTRNAPEGTTAAGTPQPSGFPPYEEFTVPVDGGDLAVVRWPAARPDAPVVLAAHGITANGLSWARVAHHLAGRVTLLAADLRGRGASGTLPAPYGVGAHARDLAAVADASGAARLAITGHSMGAFVAAVAAVRYPSRFQALVMVDGGVGFPLPVDLPPDELITAVIGPAMRRLSMTFSDRAAYLDFWRAHPAFAATWSPWVEAYIQRDLIGTEPRMRSSCAIEAVRVDGVGQFEPEVLEAVRRLPCPARLLWAERGVMDEPRGLYSEELLATAALDPERVTATRVPGANHYTVLVGDEGARTVARHLLQSVEGWSPER